MVSYKKLWHLLIDKNMNKRDLIRASGISSATLAKINRNENMQTDVLVKICHTLNCNISDIMDILPDDGTSAGKR